MSNDDPMGQEIDPETLRMPFTLEISGKAHEALKAMVVDTDSRSKSEVVVDALRLYRWYIDTLRAGKSLATYQDGETNVVEIQF